MAYTVVWFKRDLRVHDHAPLAHAARQGPVLCLYVIEPSLWAQPDAALQHYRFMQESLADLAQDLRRCGAVLQVTVGEVPELHGVSAGGMPTRVKCLHALIGHALAAGPGVNPIGDLALERADWRP